MKEVHPFKPFVPKNSKYLLLGSFPGAKTPENTWYYGTKRTQLWKILEGVYKTNLESVEERKKLFNKIKLSVSDVILECERIRGTNLDNNLKILSYNTKAAENILKNNDIKKIFFSSRFVEGLYKRFFKDFIEKYPKVELITLPSPSPRYAKLKLEEKVKIYKNILPKLG